MLTDPVHRDAINDIVRRAAQRAGLIGDYGSHSPRAGFTTDCIDAGITREQVQHHGRWTNIRSLDPYYRKTSTWGPTNPATQLAQHDTLCMVAAAEALVVELEGSYAYTESDEISVLLSPRWDLFDRSVEKLVSVSAGIASAAFTHACGEPAHFDSRVWLGTGVSDVVDYFRWQRLIGIVVELDGHPKTHSFVVEPGTDDADGLHPPYAGSLGLTGPSSIARARLRPANGALTPC